MVTKLEQEISQEKQKITELETKTKAFSEEITQLSAEGKRSAFREEQLAQAGREADIAKRRLVVLETSLRKGEALELAERRFGAGEQQIITGERFQAGRLATGELRRKQLAQFEEAGLKPVIRDSEIIGFEDVIRQQSFRTEELGIIGEERLFPLEERGLITREERIVTQELAPEILEPPKFERETRLGIAKDILVGERGRQLVGITIPTPVGLAPSPTPDITFQEIKIGLGERGVAGKVVGGFIPTTPLGVGLTAFAPIAFTRLPAVGRVGVETFFIVTEAPKVFDPTLTTEERITGGIVGGLSGLGFTAETAPFIRGLPTLVSPKRVGIGKAEEGFEFIKGVDIGLIQPKKGAPEVQLPRISPLRRGGFGVQPSEKEFFLGGGQILVTSQRGLFKVGKEIPLEKEFFVTPQEPFLKIGETRVSRLGLPTGFFEFPKEIQIGFGLPPKPQIGIIKAGVGRIETVEQFAIGKGTELEAIKTFGTIKDVKLTKKTIIKGVGVDIFEFEIGKGVKGKPTKDILGRTPSTVKKEFISGTGLLGETLGLPSIRTTKRVSFITTTISKPVSFGLPTFPTKPTKPTAELFPPPTQPVSLPTSLPVSLGVSPPVTFPVSPPISPPLISSILPPLKKKLFKIPKFRMEQEKFSILGERKFVKTPSLASLIKFELGLKQPRFERGLQETGLFERPFEKPVELGSLLGKVTRKTTKKKKGGKK